MYRKVSLIVFLAVLLGAFLVLRPYIFAKKENPTLLDRLPDGDFLAQAYVLDLAKDMSGMLYFHKVSFREFLSEEFILQQAKIYGIQLQKPSYLFANQEEMEMGGLIEVADSSRLGEGILRLKRYFPIQDTFIDKQHVYKFEDFDGYLTYGKDYLFYYHGKQPTKNIRRVIHAKKNQVSSHWQEFINISNTNKKHLLVTTYLKELNEVGIRNCYAYPTIDSTHIEIQMEAIAKDTIPFKLLKTGQSIPGMEYTKRLANVHLDISSFKNQKDDLLYQYLSKQAKKIGFPFDQFIQAWTGNLSLRQGGFFNIKETYIETEFDENFMPTEVEKVRDVRVTGFSLHYTVNEKGKSFIQNLRKKGILTEQEGKDYFLLSPPLNTKFKATEHLYYSSTFPPKMVEDPANYIHWSYLGTIFEFNLKSIDTYRMTGSVRFETGNLLNKKELIE